MRKTILGLVLTLILIGCGKENTEKNKVKKKIRIGITQIREHPSLDVIRRGIKNTIEKSQYKDQIVFDYKNAQGSLNTAKKIGKEFNKKDDIIIAISTPSAQATLSEVHKKPIFFSAVTNPSIAGLEGENISGVSDMSSTKEQVELLQELLPKAKTIGIIYSSDEANSIYTATEFSKIAKKKGYKVIMTKIAKTSDIISAVNTLAKKIDVLYTSDDNRIAFNYPLIVKEANKVNLPIIGGTKDFTRAGALAASGVSEYLVGIKTAEMLLEYLDGTPIKDLPTKYIEYSELTANKDQMARFHIKLNDKLKNKIHIMKNKIKK